MCIIYATSPGYVAYRDEVTGSFFLSTLCKVFCEHACDEHLGDLMLRVHGNLKKDCVSSERGLQKQTPSLELIGWDKKLYFNPGLRGLSDKAYFLPHLSKCTIM